MNGTAQKDSNKKASDLWGYPCGLRQRASLPVSLAEAQTLPLDV